MCGIFGTFMKGDRSEAERGLDLITHRGPDGRGIVEVGEAIHGHVRLALLDLTDASAQPFRVGRGALSFVGEVWNHAELRDELRKDGVEFRTTGDTEVLARSLERRGPTETLERLDGMFAFAWSDGRGADVLARDRYGKVPLYVVRRGKTFAWSSERRGLGPDAGRAVALPPGSALDR